ncbi:hypothetical protein OFB61_25035, partial [Escherichia coli]|nr:hypothetical protein [Escherichia coli]
RFLILKDFAEKVRDSEEIIKLLYYFDTKFKDFNNEVNTITEVKDKLIIVSKKEVEDFKAYVTILEDFKI